MGTIAEKLSYLADTKDLFKDRLNSLGAEITSSTTFRNYLNWLDTFYGEVSDKTDLSVNGVVGRTSQNTAILPSEYTQVDYIESHGEEWIDTNVFPYRTTVEYTFAYNNFTTGTYRRFVASFDVTSSPTLRYYSCQANGDNPDRFVCASYANTIYGLGDTDTNKHTIIFNDNNGNVYFDGVLKATSENFDLPRQLANNLSIFATGGATGSSKIAGKLWSLKIYDKENNNELVRDFIPCYRNSDNEVGLYDLVNGVFYTNQGTGSFTYGSVVSIPNPDYPQPINNLSGDVAYKVSGKNLLDTNRMVQFTPSSATWYSVDGIDRFYNTTQIIKSNVYYDLKANTTYTFSVYSTLNKNTSASNPIQLVNKSEQVITSISQNNTYMTFTTTEDIRVYPRMSVQSANVLTQCIVQLEENSTATDFEPYISQTFDIPLKSKNLFDGLTTKGSYNTVTGKVETTIYNMWRNTNPIGVNPNNDYVFSLSGTALSVPFRVFYYDINKMFISTETTTNGKFITPADCYYVNWHSTALYTNYPNGLTNVMIEESSAPTNYEPYYDIELCKIDTYEDKIYSSNGRFYLNKKTGKVVLNGSESWKKTNTQYQGLFSASITLPTMKRQNIFSGDIYANYFKENKFATQEEGITKSSSPLSYDVIIIRLFENRASDVKSFITWLSTHNTEVQYVLATPTTTEITQENYPSLYNALKQIQDYLTAYKINKEFILGYSSPEIEY